MIQAVQARFNTSSGAVIDTSPTLFREDESGPEKVSV